MVDDQQNRDRVFVEGVVIVPPRSHDAGRTVCF